MKITFFGTGTSVGVPMIGCDCRVCRSADPRNRRRRSCLHVATAQVSVIVDTPPDFREQALTFNLQRVDAVLITHAHADHIFGFDDIRRFNTTQQQVIPVYAASETIADLRRIFPYVGKKHVAGLYRPLAEFCEQESPFSLGDLRIEPVEVDHGATRTFGYRFDGPGSSVGYAPDCHAMSAHAIDRFRGVDVMILDALKHHAHQTHLTVADSLELLETISPRRAYFVHMCHELDHAETESVLPTWVRLSYDGLSIESDD